MSTWKEAASCVMFVTFVDGNQRTFYSKDKDQKADNVHFWYNHLRKLAEEKKDWKGRVKEYVIYRCANGKPTGEPIVKKKFEIVY